MGKLHAIGNVTVRVYGSDHPPAHCHVTGPEGEAVASLATLTVTHGGVHRSSRDAVMTWVAANGHVIVAERDRLNPRFPTE